MQEKLFNLTNEPWIIVADKTGVTSEVSLTEVLINAHKYHRLAGETLTQDVSILRLLLSVLHTVIHRTDTDGDDQMIEDENDALDRWKFIWNQKKFPETDIRSYLETWKDRFYLFHPEYPFYQVPEHMNLAKINSKGLRSVAKLNGEISQSGNKVRIFASRNYEEREKLTYAEAARWLLYTNAFDDKSIKKASDQKTVAAKYGWLGDMGVIFAEGENLFETLMLNLVLLNHEECWGEPHPVWERDQISCEDKKDISMPNNQAELLTVQSRRITLNRDGNYVTSFNIYGGDFISEINASNEQMTMWYVEQKTNKAPVYRPKKKDPSKQMWRDFSNSLLPDQEEIQPGVIKWIKYLERKGLISRRKIIRFRTISIKYDAKGQSIKDSSGDYLDFYANLLPDTGKKYVTMIGEEIERCEKAANIIGAFAVNLERAKGDRADYKGKDNSPYIRAKEDFFYRIDLPFRRWLLTVSPDSDISDLRQRWQEEIWELAKSIGYSMINQAGKEAFKGHEYNNHYYTSSGEYGKFMYLINECFGRKEKKDDVNE